MAYTGQVIENPVSGERITFRRTSADTNGELLEFDVELAPDGHVPGMHVHPAQAERFEVLDGAVRFRKGFSHVTARAGDVVTVEPGTAHKFQTVGGKGAVMRVQVTPALQMERLLRDGHAARRGGPGYLQGHAEAARARAVRPRVQG